MKCFIYLFRIEICSIFIAYWLASVNHKTKQKKSYIVSNFHVYSREYTKQNDRNLCFSVDCSTIFTCMLSTIRTIVDEKKNIWYFLWMCCFQWFRISIFFQYMNLISTFENESAKFFFYVHYFILFSAVKIIFC